MKVLHALAPYVHLVSRALSYCYCQKLADRIVISEDLANRRCTRCRLSLIILATRDIASPFVCATRNKIVTNVFRVVSIFIPVFLAFTVNRQ